MFLIENEMRWRFFSIFHGINGFHKDMILLSVQLTLLLLAASYIDCQFGHNSFPFSLHYSFNYKTKIHWASSTILIFTCCLHLWFVIKRLTMNKGNKQKKTKQQDFSQILKAKNQRLERSKRVIDKILSQSIRLKPPINPENKFHIKQPKIDALEHFSDSDYSLKDQQYNIDVPSRALPKLHQKSATKQKYQTVQMTEEQLLAEKARQFVQRLRKQKQYNQGKYVVLRKKQEQRKIKEQRLIKKYQQQKETINRTHRLSHVMDSILMHEEKINIRMSQSLNRMRKSSIRTKTQASNRNNDQYVEQMLKMDSQIGRNQLPTILSLREKISQLSTMIHTLNQK